MILIMVIKISFKMKIMKNISIIDFMEIITINDNSHISTKRKTKQYVLYPNHEESDLSNMQHLVH